MTAVAIDAAGRGLPVAVPNGDRPFFVLLAGCLSLVMTAALIVSEIELPRSETDRTEQAPLTVVWDVPEPPPPLPKPKSKPKPPPKPKVVPPPREVVVEEPAAPEPESAASVRERVREAGVLAFADVLADLREETSTRELEETKIVQRGPGDAPRLERSILVTADRQAPATVEVAPFTRVSGGVALAARETTRVRALPEEERPNGHIGARRVVESEAPVRSIEEIRRVFDANKGAIFALYNRALRKHPGLAGKVVLELVIEPSGEVAACRVTSSEIDEDELIERLVRRVGMFDFGAKAVERTTVTYPVHFLPS